MDRFDVLVIGGGIAGASAAYHLSGSARVLLAETEPVLAFHTTGRSAAQYLENYGSDQVRRLTLASRSFLERPAEAEPGLLSPRALLVVGGPDRRPELVELAEQGRALVPSIRLVDAAEAATLCPALRPDHAVVGVLEPDASDIDVARLHQVFVGGLRRNGGEVRVVAPVTALARTAGGWRATLGGEPVEVAAVVNAAGAWADRVARLAGLAPVGLRPLRRTAFTASCDLDTAGWPLVNDVAERWYFKPEGGGQLLCSLADETPSEPGDAKPDEADVALALERINEATTLRLRHVRTAWAGLRTFAPDRELVLGADPAEPTCVWSAGQGGYGIQTAPAAGALVAAAVLGAGLPPALAATGVLPTRVSPARFAG